MAEHNFADFPASTLSGQGFFNGITQGRRCSSNLGLYDGIPFRVARHSGPPIPKEISAKLDNLDSCLAKPEACHNPSRWLSEATPPVNCF
jgi:hypothetical protein